MCVSGSVYTPPLWLCTSARILMHVIERRRSANKGRSINGRVPVNQAKNNKYLNPRCARRRAKRRGQMRTIVPESWMISPAFDLFLATADVHNSQANLASLT